jgi:adenosylcobinamide amidohydrolase
MLVWRLPRPTRAIASGPFGGGLSTCHWVMNATVDKAYRRTDPEVHIAELARGLGLSGPGAGLLTAVHVGEAVSVADGGVKVTATVGLGHPTWAAAPDNDLRAGPGTVNAGTINPGTINIVAFLPVFLSDAALVNAVITATEAKSQALWEYGVEATGTATDALFIGCGGSWAGTAAAAELDTAEPFAGPRSIWGARLARAVYAAVAGGTSLWLARYGR